MGITGGAMTVRRLRVEGEVPADFRSVYPDLFATNAFQEPLTEVGKEEVEGWCNYQNLLDTEFNDVDRWLFGDYAVFALRVDKKSLPAKLFSATLAKRCELWAAERNKERCPGSVKAEMKEALEAEWLKRTLPRVAVTEACWNIPQGYLLLHSLSESMMDRFRKRFRNTFGLTLVPLSPLDWVEDEAVVESLLAGSPANLHGVR
ncbi:MAG: recombination-associated protein RdgC [Deltaproteobacteria bacterium]|nr:recombination-associated protein RdgC [Deltaproteobacteria bacterium]